MAIMIFECPKCGSNEHEALDATLNLRCAKCGRDTTFECLRVSGEVDDGREDLQMPPVRKHQVRVYDA